MIERQELYCHWCSRYVQFELDITVNGNYVLDCPNCGHQHCRVVRDGVITDVRWDARNGPAPWTLNNLPVIHVTSATSSSTSTFTTYTDSSGSSVLYDTFYWAYGDSTTA